MQRLLLALLSGLVLLTLLTLNSGAAPVAQETVRFAHVDVYVDPAGSDLAAWQVRLTDPSGRVKIVGVEGGEDPVFRDAPYYDPQALHATGEIVLAAFHTTGAGPQTNTRVARVHLHVRGNAPIELDAQLEAAACDAGPLSTARASLIQ